MRYGIHGTPTTFALEEAIARLEGGHAAVALPSGLAAIVAALAPFAKKGDHLLMVDSVYGPARNFCERRLKSYGVDIEYYDPLIGGGIAKMIRPNTTAIYCEAPGSLTFEMQDIPAIAAAAHAKNLPVLADNTWGTPYFFRSFEHGVDVSIHAGTKYVVGHSDALMGLVVTNEKYWLTVRRAVADFGYCVSPDDCYLALRGCARSACECASNSRTHSKSRAGFKGALRCCAFFIPHSKRIPDTRSGRRDFDGAASLFGVILKPVADDAVASMIDALTLFGIGSSWGGFESLCIRANPAKGRTATKWSPGGPLIRLHIGLEDADDLLADLTQAFAALRAT
jgi:cystathionine beta-lyase